MTQTKNKHNLQVGDKIQYNNGTYTISDIRDEGVQLVAGAGYDRWAYVNKNIEDGGFVIVREDKKEIIGYKCPMDLFSGKVKTGELYIKYSNSAYSVDRSGNSVYFVPKEIVETWEPVYKEQEVKLTIGNPAKEVIVTKYTVCYGDTILNINKDVKPLLKLFCDITTGPVTSYVKKIWVGCSSGTEVTKEEILEVIKIAEEL